MLNKMPMALTVITLLLGALNAKADGNPVPTHTCDPTVVDQIYSDNTDQELIDAVNKHFVTDVNNDGTDERFCAWLEGQAQTRTEAAWDCKCGVTTPQTEDVEELREVTKVVYRDRPVYRESSTNWGQLLGVGALGVAGGLLLSKYLSKNNQPQQYYPPRQYFQQPQWPSNLRPYQNGGVNPWPGMNAPGVIYPGQQAGLGGQVRPYQGIPSQQYAGAQQYYGQYPSITNAQYLNPPAVLPIQAYSVAPQSYTPNYSLINP